MRPIFISTAERDSLVYRFFSWLECNRKQTAWRWMFWLLLRTNEDRTRLKHENRRLKERNSELGYKIWLAGLGKLHG